MARAGRAAVRLATGITAEAALQALRQWRPRRLVLAEPVCAVDTARRLGRIADEIVCLFAPDIMWAVGMWYQDFTPVSDEEVRDLLQEVRRLPRATESKLTLK